MESRKTWNEGRHEGRHGKKEGRRELEKGYIYVQGLSR